MPSSDEPRADPARPDAIDDAIDGIDEAALERVMNEVPRGALALSGLTVALLMLAWFLIYVYVFLPRGMVG